MIKKIIKIKNFGIYKNFTWSNDLKEFNKFNLFYGWNGSGKTTLTKLFTILEQKNDDNLLKNLTDYEFEFLFEESTIINQKNYKTNNLNIYVYNEVFKQQNIDWDNIVKSILLISDKTIKEKEILKEKKQELGNENITNTILGKIKKYNDEKLQLSNEIEKFFSNAAKQVKNEFQVIDTSDRYYFNYDKRKFSKFIETNRDKIQDKTNKLNVYEVEKLKQSIKPNILDEIHLEIKTIDYQWLENIKNKVEDIARASLIVKEVERLKQYPDIGKWVEEGLKIHKLYNSTKCEFCGQKLTSIRLKDLEQHFGNEFEKLKERIQIALDCLSKQKIADEITNQDIKFYPEFQDEFKKIKNEIRIYIENINNLFDEWIEILKQKINNPFKIITNIKNINVEDLENYNSVVMKLKNLINKHNNKTKNFEDESKKLKEKLELHYAITLSNDFKLNQKEKKLQKIKNDIQELLKTKEKLEEEIKKLEAKLSNEIFGAEDFNKKLHKFLGRNDISLKFDKEQQGYEIIRNKQKATNLSEGEKTAISFVYFITKLKENENKIENSIIIVDDPISSFDSNNLFSSYSFLKNECEKARQLFIMTHNFSYFKLIRDWLTKKNKKKNSQEIIKSNFYVIETITQDIQRVSTIKNATSSLIDYQSEYHFIFSKVYYYRNKEINLSEAYLIGNLLRKLLESFLSFKYPKKRNDFKTLCDKAIKDKNLNEKIYRFINKYSHNQSIDFFEMNDDNILLESKYIINDVLEEIKKIDSQHFEEMEEIVLNE